MITVELNNRQAEHAVDAARLRAAAKTVLRGEGIRSATISIAVVDEPTIRQLNRRYLAHDDATDVLSFVLERDEGYLDGEVVVSPDAAAQAASAYGWSAADELLLYVIHGVLHLVGYDDRTPADRREMRQKEKEYLARHGLTPCYDDEAE